MPASFPQSFYQTCTWPLPHVGPRRSMRNMSASLPRSFYQTYQTCTRPLPTLGQSETCETCQHRNQNIFIKHAQGLSPRWAKAKHTKHASIASTKFLSNMHNAQGLVPSWAKAKHTKHAGIASTKFPSNMHKASSHDEPKRNMRNMPASLPEHFYQTCTRPLPTLGQSETCETCQHRFQNIFIKHAQGPFPRWAKAKDAKHAGIASTKFPSNMHKASSHVGPKRNMRNMPAASLPKVSIKHAQGLFPRWAKAKHAKHASMASTKFPSMTEVKADVAKCHACHAKWRWMSHDVAKCHNCHAKRRWMLPSATLATQNEGGSRQVPRLPRQTKVHVAKCHACHAKWRCLSPSATLATQSAAASTAPKRRPSGAQAAPKRRPSGAQAAPKRRPSGAQAAPNRATRASPLL